MTKLVIWLKIAWAALISRSNQAFYDRISPIYDEAFTTHRIHAEAIIKILGDACAESEQEILVLDLGCGTGLLSQMLADRGFKVVSLDMSLESLRLLLQRNDQINAVQGDAERLPIASAQLQSVVSLGVWRHLAHPVNVLDEIVRVLAPTGTLVIGYFPPALGGVFRAGNGGLGELLLWAYHYLIRKLGYTDRVDADLETETLEGARQRFGETRKIESGAHWHLVFAQHPRRQ